MPGFFRAPRCSGTRPKSECSESVKSCGKLCRRTQYSSRRKLPPPYGLRDHTVSHVAGRWRTIGPNSPFHPARVITLRMVSTRCMEPPRHLHAYGRTLVPDSLAEAEHPALQASTSSRKRRSGPWSSVSAQRVCLGTLSVARTARGTTHRERRKQDAPSP
jgi:hypothetical protein